MMDPDRAHRLLNTVLIVLAIGLLNMGGGTTESGFLAVVNDIVIAATFGTLIFLTFWIVSTRMDEVQEYLGFPVK